MTETKTITAEVVDVTTLDTAKPAEAEFQSFVTELERLKRTAETLTVESESDANGMKLVRTTRLALRSIRIDIDKRRKELTEGYLRKKQAIDGLAKELIGKIEPLEDRLLDQEKFAERIAEQRRADLQAERAGILRELGVAEVLIPKTLGDAIPEEWNIALKAAQAAKDARDAEVKRLEEERIAREKAAEEERIRREQELAEAKTKAEEERKAREAAEAAAKAERERAEAARLEAERVAAAERAAAEAEHRRLEAEAAKKLADERKARDAAEAELRAQAAKAEAEAKAERERVEAELRAQKEQLEASLRAELLRKEVEAKAKAAAEAQAKAAAEAAAKAAKAPDFDKIRTFEAAVHAAKPRLSDGALDDAVDRLTTIFLTQLVKLAQ